MAKTMFYPKGATRDYFPMKTLATVIKTPEDQYRRIGTDFHIR
jgi:hypothetical protein